MIVIKKLDELHINELSSYLNHYQETTMFIRNNLYHSGITYQDAPFHGEYYGSFENNKINGVLAHYWNGNLMMQTENFSALSALASCSLFACKQDFILRNHLSMTRHPNFSVKCLD
ncbi:GNAT family acetyltransferase [Legionella santicrucis]|uniref:GNAT family acetyltransferase n=1 Tax=Legionella santicrucis TaxID=45074 RepID=A0A0W0ZLV1_9GAMM|nr:GNAT family acetyltransferase [Legionella santicrucis]